MMHAQTKAIAPLVEDLGHGLFGSSQVRSFDTLVVTAEAAFPTTPRLESAMRATDHAEGRFVSSVDELETLVGLDTRVDFDASVCQLLETTLAKQRRYFA